MDLGERTEGFHSLRFQYNELIFPFLFVISRVPGKQTRGDSETPMQKVSRSMFSGATPILRGEGRKEGRDRNGMQSQQRLEAIP